MACCRKLFWQKLYISCAANFAVHPAWQPPVQIFVTTCMCATNRTMLSCIGTTSYNPNRRGLGWNFAVVEKKIRFRITKTFRFCRSNLETHGIMIPNYLRLNCHFVFEKAKMKIGRSDKKSELRRTVPTHCEMLHIEAFHAATWTAGTLPTEKVLYVEFRWNTQESTKKWLNHLKLLTLEKLDAGYRFLRT